MRSFFHCWILYWRFKNLLLNLCKPIQLYLLVKFVEEINLWKTVRRLWYQALQAEISGVAGWVKQEMMKSLSGFINTNWQKMKKMGPSKTCTMENSFSYKMFYNQQKNYGQVRKQIWSKKKTLAHTHITILSTLIKAQLLTITSLLYVFIIRCFRKNKELIDPLAILTNVKNAITFVSECLI